MRSSLSLVPKVIYVGEKLDYQEHYNESKDRKEKLGAASII